MEMRWLRQRFDDFKAPAMLQRRNTGTCLGDFCGIDLGHNDPRLGVTLGKNAPPWVNDQ